MITQQYNFKTLPMLAIAEGATSPDLGSDGVSAWAWSTLLAKPMYWNGAHWTAGSGGSAGTGGPAIELATITFNPAQFGSAVVTVAAATVVPASRVQAWLSPNADWDADDLAGYLVTATARSGTIEFCITGIGPLAGTFDICYFWS